MTKLSVMRPTVFDAASAKQQLGDLTTGRAFDNNCICADNSVTCLCGAARLAPEQHFVQSLVSISNRLSPLPTSTCLPGSGYLSTLHTLLTTLSESLLKQPVFLTVKIRLPTSSTVRL